MTKVNSSFNDKEEGQRIERMMQVVDSFVMLTDDRNDLLALACVMMAKSRDIFDSHLGIEGRLQMFLPMLNAQTRR